MTANELYVVTTYKNMWDTEVFMTHPCPATNEEWEINGGGLMTPERYATQKEAERKIENLLDIE